jgi:hypothetical protein
MDLPVHAGRFLVEDLQTVGAHVADARVGVLADADGKRDVGAAVLGPAFQIGKDRQVGLLQNDVLAGAARNRLRHVTADLGQLRQHAEFFQKTRGRGCFDQGLQFGGDLLDVFDAQGPGHAFPRPVGVDEKWESGLLPVDLDHVFEKQGGSSGLGHPVGDFRDLQIGFHRFGDADEGFPFFRKETKD